MTDKTNKIIAKEGLIAISILVFSIIIAYCCGVIVYGNSPNFDKWVVASIKLFMILYLPYLVIRFIVWAVKTLRILSKEESLDSLSALDPAPFLANHTSAENNNSVTLPKEIPEKKYKRPIGVTLIGILLPLSVLLDLARNYYVKWQGMKIYLMSGSIFKIWTLEEGLLLIFGLIGFVLAGYLLALSNKARKGIILYYIAIVMSKSLIISIDCLRHSDLFTDPFFKSHVRNSVVSIMVNLFWGTLITIYLTRPKIREQFKRSVTIASAKSIDLNQNNPKIGLPDSVKYAGFWKRFVAATVDTLIIFLIGLIPTIVIVYIGVTAGYSQDSMNLAGLTMWAIIGCIYYANMESSSKQATVGKTAMGIIVTDMDGKRISFGKAAGRYFGKYISGAILMIGYIMAAFTPKKQALHDIMVGCLVVKADQTGSEK